MTYGTTNVYLGNRAEFEKCKYWAKDTDSKDIEDYVSETTPKGTISVSERTTHTHSTTQIDSFMGYRETLNLYTKSPNELVKQDIIEYQGEIWRVGDVQKTRIKRNSQYMKQTVYETSFAVWK